MNRLEYTEKIIRVLKGFQQKEIDGKHITGDSVTLMCILNNLINSLVKHQSTIFSQELATMIKEGKPDAKRIRSGKDVRKGNVRVHGRKVRRSRK